MNSTTEIYITFFMLPVFLFSSDKWTFTVSTANDYGIAVEFDRRGDHRE